MRNPQQIIDLYRQRRVYYTPLHQKMSQIADIYNGRAEVPLPDMERDERPAIPNLLAQGVDQMAGRITSVTPAVTFSSMKPGVRKYDRMAVTAADTVTGWWQADRLMMKMKQRGRRMIAYGMAPVIVRWNYDDHRPTWQVRHPLETFPSTDIQPGQVTPTDCIFVIRRSIGWMVDAGYGDKIPPLIGNSDGVTRDTQVTLIEYIDCDHTVLLATGYFPTSNWIDTQYADLTIGPSEWGSNTQMRAIVLENYPNLSDECPVVIPTRLTLDQMTGQFDNMIGMYYQQAKLMALETIAVEKGIFPDTYLISRPGEVGRFLDGPHDGRTGLVNIVAGGDIKELQSSPGYLTNPTLDRLERAQRVTAGVPAEFGGESGSNIRTGRRGDAVLSAVIDFPVAEAQETFAFALEEENEVAIGLAKRIDGSTQRTIFVGTGNNRRPVTYKPSETFEQDEHVVSYPAAGSDVNSLVIGLGQRVGLGTMSKFTAATLDPYIDNPEQEHDQIIAEGLEQAIMSGLQQQAASGQLPPLVGAKIMSLVRNDRMELAEAIAKVTEDAAKAEQEKQQQQMMQGGGQAGAPTPDQMSAPAALAAMAGPQASAAVNGPNPSQQNLGALLTTLRRGSRSVA